jgi:hypothetical protein
VGVFLLGLIMHEMRLVRVMNFEAIGTGIDGQF